MTKMNRAEKFLCLMTYYQVEKQLHYNQNLHLHLLDLGCGDGLFLLNLNVSQERQSKLTYVGTDISLYKLHFAKKAISNLDGIDIHFVLADVEHLPFRASVFEVETAIEVIEHLLNLNDLVLELDRVAKPQGKLIITTPSAYGSKGGFLALLKRLCHIKQSVSCREKYLFIQGKKIPHRDFVPDEIAAVLFPSFTNVKISSFNFRIFHQILSKLLPPRILEWVILFLENRASMFPSVWGNNWLICAQNK
jgi:ubiquinone/menaquinone biosynthesis C-methylase UbiE